MIKYQSAAQSPRKSRTLSTFTVINEATLVQAISGCMQRLVYIAPGITDKVVAAMRSALKAKASAVEPHLPADSRPAL